MKVHENNLQLRHPFIAAAEDKCMQANEKALKNFGNADVYVLRAK